MGIHSDSSRPTPPPLPIKLTDDDIEEVVSQFDKEVNTDLEHVFNLQECLMRRYRDENVCQMPDWPVDIGAKVNQQACREAGLKAVEEFFEALQHLKNWKPHRKTLVPEFDRAAFLEEIVDSLHYQFELLLFVGISAPELVEAYEMKNAKNHRRLDEDY